jgi:hypothetical protein
MRPKISILLTKRIRPSKIEEKKTVRRKRNEFFCRYQKMTGPVTRTLYIHAKKVPDQLINQTISKK